MDDRMPRFFLNRLEDTWVSFRTVGDEQYLEMRVRSDARPHEPHALPGREVILLPIRLLPDLLRVLGEAERFLRSRGLVSGQAPSRPAHTGGGEPPPAQAESGRAPVESRRHPRVPVNLPAECRLIEPDRFWPGRPIPGQLKDLSLNGAQAWLPTRLSRLKQVELTLVCRERLFRGRAEVVGVGEEPPREQRRELVRHNLHWLLIEAPAKLVLSELMSSVGEGNTRGA